MTMIDRRAMLRTLLSGVAAAATGLALVPEEGIAAPFAAPSPGQLPESHIGKAVFVSRHRRTVRSRRRHCTYRHGKRVCHTY